MQGLFYICKLNTGINLKTVNFFQDESHYKIKQILKSLNHGAESLPKKKPLILKNKWLFL